MHAVHGSAFQQGHVVTRQAHNSAVNEGNNDAPKPGQLAAQLVWQYNSCQACYQAR